MNKTLIKMVAVTTLFGSSISVNAGANWTADIKLLYTYSNGAARIFLDNLRNGPSGQTSTGCNGNGIWLSPIPNETAVDGMLSHALTMYTTKKSVRIAVDGQGNDCVVVNMGNT